MITSRARRRQEALQGQPWAGRLVSVSVALPLGQAPIPDSPLPSCSRCPAAEGHGTPTVCREPSARVAAPWEAGAGTGMVIVQQLCLRSKISSPPLILMLLPYPLHNAPICPSHVIFAFPSAMLFAQCFFPTCLFVLDTSRWLKC